MSLYLQHFLDDIEARARRESEALIKHQDTVETIGAFCDQVNARCDEHFFPVPGFSQDGNVEFMIFSLEGSIDFMSAAKDLGVLFTIPEAPARDTIILRSPQLPGACVCASLDQYQAYLAASELVPVTAEEVTK